MEVYIIMIIGWLSLMSLGNIQWQETIGGADDDYLYSVRQTLDGGYILAGNSKSAVSGDKTEPAIGGGSTYDYWIIKLNATGNIVWQNTIGGNNNDYVNTIEQTDDGGYIVGGNSSSPDSGDKSEDVMGESDYWVVKLDDVGNIQWQNTIGGNAIDNLLSINPNPASDKINIIINNFPAQLKFMIYPVT